MQQFIEFITNHPVLVGIFIALLFALLVTESRKGAAAISSDELSTQVNQQQAVVVDMRDRKDFSAGHIVNSVHVPKDKLLNQPSNLNKYKEKTVILVDAAGQHTGSVANKLKEQGFTVMRLKGGISQWQADNLPLVK